VFQICKDDRILFGFLPASVGEYWKSY